MKKYLWWVVGAVVVLVVFFAKKKTATDGRKTLPGVESADFKRGVTRGALS